MHVKLAKGDTIKLSAKRLGKGGEGKVFEVETALPHRPPLVAKLYHDPKRTAEQERKIKYLIQHPPHQTDASGHAYLVWPCDAVYDLAGRFWGFLMPRAQGTELERLCLPQLDSALTGPEWQRLAHTAPEAARLRLNICRNLCHAVAALQHKQLYVLGDLKPINVFVTPQGLGSTIDLDSVQVAQGSQVLFASQLCTPEYTPPEAYAVPPAAVRTSSWDDFSLAVILYRLLTGTHPFGGSYRNPAITTVPEAIQRGLYAHGPRQAEFAIRPSSHDQLGRYPTEVAALFAQCFVAGLQAPAQRPSAETWFACLHQLLHATPVITLFEASSQLVKDSTPIKLRWQVQHATALVLRPGGDMTRQAETSVTVAADTTFVLEATSFGGQKTTASIPVALDRQPPAIAFFKASRPVALVGDTLTLTWQLDRQARLTIDHGVGDVSGQTSSQFVLSEAGQLRYTLRAVGAFGGASQATVDVEVHPRLVLADFTANPAKIKVGQTAELSWKSQHCQRLTLVAGASRQNVTGKTSLQVSPTADTQYELLAEGYGGLQRTQERTRVRVAHPVRIGRFEPDLRVTLQGVPVVLRWQVQHHQSLHLESDGPDLPGGVEVTGTTHYEVTPSASTTYRLLARNDLYSPPAATTRVEVQPLPRLENLTLPPLPARLTASPPLPDLPGLMELAAANARPLAATRPVGTSLPAPALSGWLGRLRHLLQPPPVSTHLSPDASPPTEP